ncbi:MAG TPA: aliphatic sulfonate ABC transporter substrate-binding protein [Thermodesulfobacteriota bacterium]
MRHATRRGVLIALAAAAAIGPASAVAADRPSEIRIDYAYYSPTSLVLKEKGWLEEMLAKEGIKVRWVLSLGSNKALEFLNARSLDFGSSAGAAALLARINGQPVKSIYVYSRPEWTALVARKDSPIRTVADLKGKRIAATRGTDPHIFLMRALADHGLSERDVRVVLLQHQDGRLALEKGDVDAWAGLDPMMAQSELESGARLFYRNADLNTWGVLNTREEFAAEHPDLVLTVIRAYERARAWARENPADLRRLLAEQTRQSDAVAARQLERTDLTTAAIGDRQRKTIEEAGLALQKAGVIPAHVDVARAAADLIDSSFVRKLGVR